MSAKLAVDFLRLVFNWLSRSAASGNSISTYTVSISGKNCFPEDYPRTVLKIEELLVNRFHKRENCLPTVSINGRIGL
jgi:hypothetical protein